MSKGLIGTVSQIGSSTDSIGRAVAQAMTDAPDYQFVLEHKPDRTQSLAWFFSNFAAKLAIRYGQLLSTSANDGGIYTFAPGKSPSLIGLLRAGVLSLPRHFGWVGAWRAFLVGLQLEKHRLALTSEPHWYVLAVGVAPDQQGLGKGKRLVEEILERADLDQVPCYLEVFEEELIALYEPMGFKVLSQFRLPGDLTLWCLQRPAQAC